MFKFNVVFLFIPFVFLFLFFLFLSFLSFNKKMFAFMFSVGTLEGEMFDSAWPYCLKTNCRTVFSLLKWHCLTNVAVEVAEKIIMATNSVKLGHPVIWEETCFNFIYLEPSSSSTFWLSFVVSLTQQLNKIRLFSKDLPAKNPLAFFIPLTVSWSLPKCSF